jgi:hypothetical protein
MSFPRPFFRAVVLMLLLALPLQGVSAAGMLFCATMHGGDAAAMTHADHAAHLAQGGGMPDMQHAGPMADHDCAACAACAFGAALPPAPLVSAPLPGSPARVAHLGRSFHDFLPAAADKPPILFLA